MTFKTATLPLGHDDIIKAASKLYMQHKKSPTIGKKSEICMQPIKLRLSDIWIKNKQQIIPYIKVEKISIVKLNNKKYTRQYLNILKAWTTESYEIKARRWKEANVEKNHLLKTKYKICPLYIPGNKQIGPSQKRCYPCLWNKERVGHLHAHFNTKLKKDQSAYEYKSTQKHQICNKRNSRKIISPPQEILAQKTQKEIDCEEGFL